MFEQDSDFYLILPVAVRVAAVVFTAPVLGVRSIPWIIRIWVSVGLTIAVVPTVVGNSDSISIEPVKYALSLINEILIGSLMGLSLWVMLAAIKIVGGLVESMSGLSLAGMLDSSASDGGSSPISQLFWWTLVAVFVAAGGINQIVNGLLNSFLLVPVGSASFDQSYLDFFVSVLTSSFEFGMRAAMPAVVALFASTIVLGMTQKSMPQFGGMQIGLGTKSILGILLTSLLLISAPWVIFGGCESVFDQFEQFLTNASKF